MKNNIPSFNEFMNEDKVNEAAEKIKQRISARVEIIGYAGGNIQIRDVKNNEVIDLYSDEGSIEALYYFIKDFSKKYRNQNLD